MSYEQIRVQFFLISLFTLIALEYLLPRRRPVSSIKSRWRVNFSLTIFNSIMPRLLGVILPYEFAVSLSSQPYGISSFMFLGSFLQILLSFLLLDLLVYVQHLIFHLSPFFWRFHCVHHSDLDLDVSSGFRFHIGEILMSIAIKCSFIFLIGAHPVGVLIAEIALSTGSLFNHANINLGRFDKPLRWLIVSPDMHRIHHNVSSKLTNSNFSFSLSLWDRVFGTYISPDRFEHKDMALGLRSCRKTNMTGLLAIMKMPLIGHRGK